MELDKLNKKYLDLVKNTANWILKHWSINGNSKVLQLGNANESIEFSMQGSIYSEHKNGLVAYVGKVKRPHLHNRIFAVGVPHYLDSGLPVLFIDACALIGKEMDLLNDANPESWNFILT